MFVSAWGRWPLIDSLLRSKAVIRRNQARRSAVKAIGANVLGASVMMLATTVVSVQAQNPDFDVNQSPQTNSVEGSLEGSAPQSQPLFTIGELGVHVWAPVESPYDSHANTNLATGSLFGTDPSQSGY
jgi:hypothetical protein